MADRSAIEWTDATWNPIRARNLATGKVGWHCEHVTPGCEHCYAERDNHRFGTKLPFKPGHRKDVEIFLDETMLTQPGMKPISGAAITAAENVICVERPDIDLDMFVAVIRADGEGGIAKARSKAAAERSPIWRALMARWLRRVTMDAGA